MGCIDEKDIRQTIRSYYNHTSQTSWQYTMSGEFANLAQIRGKDSEKAFS
jgi:hypothetical protein